MEGDYEDHKNGNLDSLAENMPWDEMTVDSKANPPAYSEKNNSASYPAQNAPIAATTGAPAYPPQPHHTQSTSRTLNVYYKSWKNSSVRILDTDDVTELFTAKCSMRKPHLDVVSVQTGASIGTVTFHCLSCRFDASVRGCTIPMTACGTLGRKGHSFSSLARGGATMRWKYQNCNLDLLCVDEHEVPVARFQFSNWSTRKAGKFELLGPVADDGGPVLEEIIVTGLAMAEYVLSMRMTAC